MTPPAQTRSAGTAAPAITRCLHRRPQSAHLTLRVRQEGPLRRTCESQFPAVAQPGRSSARAGATPGTPTVVAWRRPTAPAHPARTHHVTGLGDHGRAGRHRPPSGSPSAGGARPIGAPPTRQASPPGGAV